MKAFSLPSLSATVTVVDKATGKATREFMRYWNEFKVALDAQENSQDTAILALQTALAAISAARTAQNTANANANSGTTGGVTQAGTGGVTLDDTAWAAAASVTFSGGVAASHVTLGASGPVETAPGVVTPGTAFNGDVRVVSIVAGVETVLEVQPFSVLKQTYPDPSELTFSGFTYDAASATTGTISYRLDARRSGGSNSLTNCQVQLIVKRTP